MPKQDDQMRAIIQNLEDAGCGQALMEQFVELVESGHLDEGLSLLEKHRRYLLDCCHTEQKRIDCLDYLIYTLENPKDQIL